MLKHLLIKQQKRTTCKICNFKMDAKHASRHMTNKHSVKVLKKTQQICTMCEKEFFDKSTLKRHKTRKHRRQSAPEEFQDEENHEATEDEANKEDEANHEATENEATKEDEENHDATEDEASKKDEENHETTGDEANREDEENHEATEDEANKQDEENHEATDEASKEDEENHEATEDDASKEQEEDEAETEDLAELCILSKSTMELLETPVGKKRSVSFANSTNFGNTREERGLDYFSWLTPGREQITQDINMFFTRQYVWNEIFGK